MYRNNLKRRLRTHLNMFLLEDWEIEMMKLIMWKMKIGEILQEEEWDLRFFKCPGPIVHPMTIPPARMRLTKIMRERVG